MANNTQRIENLEAMMAKLIESQTAMMSMMTSMQSKPSTSRGAKTKTEAVKASKSTKSFKTYEPFEKSTKTYTAKAVDSKGGNPNALLQVKFADMPSNKTRALLKAYGYRWNRANLSWDNANTDEAKEIFLILK